ncbi:MAG: hypothetical protein H6745_26970 [Deltaproteobacteria bacterium]|nr:hypothetical protein [Deltaproteobacteria bacterium]
MRSHARLPATRLSFGLLGLLALAGLACGGDEPLRVIGSACEQAAECGSGLCLSGQCVDPAADADGDGLVNQVEAALGTDPFRADTDGDGKPDGAEVDGTSNRDSDGDGVPDALESALLDADLDCLPDEVDADDAVAAAGVCPDVGVTVGAPSDWYVSEAGKSVTFAVTLADTAIKRPVDVAVTIDGGEAVATPASLHFEPKDAARPRIVTVRGVDDGDTDGHQPFAVRLAVTSPLSRGGAELALTCADDDLADEARLVDDFGATREAGLWQDERRHRTNLRVTAGALEETLDATGADGPVAELLGAAVDLTTVTAFSADVTLDAPAGVAGRHDGLVRFLFQPAADRGTRANLVALEAAVSARAGGVELVARLWSCADAGCTTALALPSPAPSDGGAGAVPAALGATYRLGVAFDRGTRAVAFTLGDRRFGATLPGGTPDLADLARVELGAAALPTSEAASGASRVRFDDVQVDGAAWDDFGAGRLAPGRWLEPATSVATASGALAVEVDGDVGYADAGLRLAAPAAARGIAARLVLSEGVATEDDELAALIGGLVGRARVARAGGGEVEGPLGAWVRVSSARAEAVVTSPLGTWTAPLGAVTLGQAVDLLVVWDGVDVTLSADGWPVVYRAAREGLAVDAAAAPESLGVGLEAAPTGAATVLGRATWDDVRLIAR